MPDQELPDQELSDQELPEADALDPARPGGVPDVAASPGTDAPHEPLLEQTEIDRLTGFEPEAAAAGGAAGTGVRAILDGPAASRDVLPMLGVAADRFAAAAGATIAKLLGPAATLALDGVRPERFGAFLADLDMPTQLFCLKAEGWSGPALLTVGPGITYLVLDRLLGGTADGRPRPFDDRPPTAIETSILRKIVGALLRDADTSFGALAPVVFTIERVEHDPAEAGIAAASDPMVAISLRLELDGRGGPIALLLPFSTLAPLRDTLSEFFSGEAAGAWGAWSGHFATELWGAPIAAEAVLHEMQLPLGRVLDLAVGDTLMLDRKPGDLVTLRCGDVILTRGRIGRVDGRIAVQVTEPLHPPVRRASPGALS